MRRVRQEGTVAEGVLWLSVLVGIFLLGTALWCAALYYSWPFLSRLFLGG